MDFTEQRSSYEKGYLTKNEISESPFSLIQKWLEIAIEQNIPEPYAMSLATCGEDGMPAVRIVLMRELTTDGIVFYTNYQSAKAQDLAENPQAEVLFFWHQLERQIRVRGRVHKLETAQSEAYFHKRPHDSQVAAWVSEPQSGIVADRDVMEARFNTLKDKYPEGTTVPKPDFWGGYLLIADEVEFWQGRSNRMHDRLLYTQDHIAKNESNLSWQVERLLP